MKIITMLLVLISLKPCFAKKAPNVLIIDSSFAPVKLKSGKTTPKTCYLINENNIEVPLKGDCYNKSDWKDVTKADTDIIRGFQDYYAGEKKSINAGKWRDIFKKFKKGAINVRNNYIVSVHGSRAAYILDEYAKGQANILYMRNLTTGLGGVKSKAGTRKNNKKYKNGCGFINWNKNDILEFNNDRLQPYQERISNVLTKYKSIRVVNLSLGYKLAWIKQDNPNCTDKQVEKEYSVLINSWKNLLKKHSNVIFVTAAGNENEKFDNPTLRKADLWANLTSMQGLSNIILVGSLNKDGTKFKSSNNGKVVNAFALGENIPVRSAIPLDISGHRTTIRGTSFSAPIVAGKAVSLFSKFPRNNSLKREVVSYFKLRRETLITNTFLNVCKKIRTKECLVTIMNMFSNDILWNGTNDLFIDGKLDWNFSPFPINYVADLNTSAKVKLLNYNGKFIPHLLLGNPENPYDLLLTLHHELVHYANISVASKHFYKKTKINNCVTDYQLALLKDETVAFKKEIEFYEKAPSWFKEGVKKEKISSRLLEAKDISYDKYYQLLKAKLNKDKKFIEKRYIELGEYPKCSLALI